MKPPFIIQGGMGIGVSNWRLARAVSQLGQLGVISGSAINTLFIRRLQSGDSVEEIQRAVNHFPFPDIAQTVIEPYLAVSKKDNRGEFALGSLFTVRPSLALQQLTALASFVEVYLAKEGHDGLVGMNLLEKFQLPNLSCIYGAMLAGVDYILMGAGIPKEIPGVLDSFADNKEASLKISIRDGKADNDVRISFDPAKVFPGTAFTQLKRPKFLGIVSSATLAIHLVQKSNGKVDGFVIEGHLAGGHNAPPRGSLRLDENGEPIYGIKDEADLEKIKQLGPPFWLAGSYGTPEKLAEALAAGAAGIQVGTAFAFCKESGFTEEIKSAVIQKWGMRSKNAKEPVYTDPLASPTGFPFKVAPISGTLSDKAIYEQRPKVCDLGYLRDICVRPDGSLVYRCPGEPEESFVRKGGDIRESEGRKCLCNSLFSAIGLGQLQTDAYSEPPLVTAGDDLIHLERFLPTGASSYSARDVVKYLVGPTCPAQ